MSKTSDFHFEQPTTQPVKDHRKEYISSIYGAKTDRELLEEQTHLAKLTAERTDSIKKNVQFFFWLAIIGLVSMTIFVIVGAS